MVGEFEVVNYTSGEQKLISKFNLEIENGYLIAIMDIESLGENLKIVLKPVSNKLAIIQGLNASGFFTSETIRIIEKNGEKMLVFSGYELKKKQN